MQIAGKRKPTKKPPQTKNPPGAQPGEAAIPPTQTRIKTFTNESMSDMWFPVKILGVSVFFSGLFYAIFVKSDVLRQHINDLIGKIKNIQSAEIPPSETPTITTPPPQSATMTPTEKDPNIDNINQKLDVVKDFVESSKAPNLPVDEPNATTTASNKGQKYCYIGEDRGVRTCASVESSDECMSGDIFVSEKQCVNPNLRYPVE